MVYETGTSFGTVSVASYNEEFGVSVGSGKVSNQTLLASQVTPPAKVSSAAEFMIVLIPVGLILALGFYVTRIELPVFFKDTALTILTIAGLGFTFTICATILFFFFKWESKASKQRKLEYTKEITRWQRSWICLRCGEKWVI
jgi:hypothetical protein